MDSIAPILSSAQQAFNNDFARMDKAATELTGSEAPGAARPTDPIAQGVVDSMLARQDVAAGTMLAHVYSRMNDAIIRMASDSTGRQYDAYA